jgi:hypothetical protein
MTVPHVAVPPPLVAETIVGGIYEIVYSRVLQGKTAELPALLPDLAYSVIVPYLGQKAAERAVSGRTSHASSKADAASRSQAGARRS